MQVEYKGDRYLLGKTIQVTLSGEKNLKETASKHGIECDVKIDPNTIS
jgi:hypothetical protein